MAHVQLHSLRLMCHFQHDLVTEYCVSKISCVVKDHQCMSENLKSKRYQQIEFMQDACASCRTVLFFLCAIVKTALFRMVQLV